MPVFWKHGFADTSLQELERATGVNKSGLYAEFRDKEDLFVACLRHYLENQGKRGLLTNKPLGWNNVEGFLKNGPLNKGELQGCFSVNSMREFAILPDDAYGVVTENRALLQHLLAINIAAEEPSLGTPIPYEGNVSPNIRRPLTDSAFVASSCSTSQCSARRPSSNRTTSAAIQAAGLPMPVKRPCAMT